MKDQPCQGGCFCGAIKFRIIGAPLSVTNCHCRDCQRVSGAPFQPWLTIRPDQFKPLRGKPARYRYGRTRVRTFCARCGSPLTFVARNTPGEIDVALCCLDGPEAFQAAGSYLGVQSAVLDQTRGRIAVIPEGLHAEMIGSGARACGVRPGFFRPISVGGDADPPIAPPTANLGGTLSPASENGGSIKRCVHGVTSSHFFLQFKVGLCDG